MSDIATRTHYDAAERAFIFERIQDCEPILERNKALQNERRADSDWGRHIASVPNVILERWIKEDGVNLLALPAQEFGALIRRKLRDPQWAFLRTNSKPI